MSSAPAPAPPLAPAPPETDQNELERLRKLLAARERDAVKLQHDLETEKQKTADALRDSEQHISEAIRLNDDLEQRSQTVSELKRGLEAEKLRQSSAEQRLREDLAAGEKMIGALRQDLAAKEQGEAAHEQAVAALKQQHEGIIQRLTTGHQASIANKDTLIGGLEKKAAELEDKVRTLVATVLPTDGSRPDASPGTPAKRKFGAMAMSVVATLFAGAGGAGGYYYHGSGDGGAQKTVQSAVVGDLQKKLNASDRINHELQDGLRSLHDAYDRLDQDLKTAQDQLKTAQDQLKTAQEQLRTQAANPGAGTGGDLQRQLTDAQLANAELQKQLAASAADIEQRKLQMTNQEQTIARMNQELLDARSQEAKQRETKSQDSKESKPRPKRASDFESTIKNLEREYGKDIVAPWNPR